MKVKLPDDYRRRFTIDDLNIAKKLIQFEKENDDMKIEEYVQFACNEVFTNSFAKCLEAKAEVAENSRIYDYHFEGSEQFDVWINATVRTIKGYMEIGFYLSDAQQTGGTPYKSRIYYRYFQLVETA